MCLGVDNNGKDADSDCEIIDDISKPSASSSSTPTLRKFTNSKSKLEALNKRTKTKYTPLEQQYVEIKGKHPSAVLLIECGYKYRFFGEDAEIAAKVLKIFCHLDHNFQTASIPVHRLFVHVRRLVAAGYKVGVVKQTETAALKAAGENRSAPFKRQLTAMYTKSTLIGEDILFYKHIESCSEEGEVSMDTSNVNCTLLCVYDLPMQAKDKEQTIGILAVKPSTGNVVYDSFVDTELRTELDTRITHTQPVEMIIPKTLTEKTQKFIDDTVKYSSTDDDKIRVEHLDDRVFEYSEAFQTVSEFYSSDTDQYQLQSVINLPHSVICCLSAMIIALSKFTTESTYLKLPGKTTRNLELFQNQTNLQERGSLFWVLNHTVTKYGNRMLRTWLSCPLLDVTKIKQRQEAVEELSFEAKKGTWGRLQGALSRTPDLEKGLCSIFYNKCSIQEFYSVVKSLSVLHTEFKILSQSIDNVKSEVLKTIICEVEELINGIDNYSDMLHEDSVRENDKTNIFKDESIFPSVLKRKSAIQDVMKDLQEHRREVRLLLKQPALDYTTVMGTEYLIEVKNAIIKVVPQDWTKISSTKTVSRFHSPFIVQKYKVLNQMREQLVIDCNEAWNQFTKSFSDNYVKYKKAVNHLATLDCLLSLATVARSQGYCRPTFVTDRVCIQIEKGQHPVITQLLGEQEQFVPNDTNIDETDGRVMIITGPNMGGKSSYIKQVALMVIMAQMGSFVPAESATFGISDAVYTRMGAADEIYRGRSTFMVELQEAAEIMSQATCRSLVILDELGRGTSTHDGMAIAYATLQFFITKLRCPTLFVTHYPMLAEFEKLHPAVAVNYHMSFFLEDEDDQAGDRLLTFLYQLVSGSAARSYGLNVARLAGIPSEVIHKATEMSHDLETEIRAKRPSEEILKVKSFLVCIATISAPQRLRFGQDGRSWPDAFYEAKDDYEKEERKKEHAKLRGEGTWMLPSLSDRIDRENKNVQKKSKKSKKEKKKKLKKEKKKSKSKKDSSTESDDSEDSGNEALWVEKGDSQGEKTQAVSTIMKGPQLQRDEWMTAPPDLFPTISRKEIREKKQQEKEENIEDDTNLLDKPGQHERELNPYWKDGGVGLPEEEPKQKAKSGVQPSVGDGGYSWMKKAYDRCVEQAKEENRSLEEIAAEKYGSLRKLQKMLADAEKAYRKIQDEKLEDQQRSRGRESKYQISRSQRFIKPREDNEERTGTQSRMFIHPDDSAEEKDSKSRYTYNRRDRSRSKDRRYKERSRSRERRGYKRSRSRSRSTDRSRNRDYRYRKSRSRSKERHYSRDKYSHRRSRSRSNDRNKTQASLKSRFMKPGDMDSDILTSKVNRGSNSQSQPAWKKKEFRNPDTDKREEEKHPSNTNSARRRKQSSSSSSDSDSSSVASNSEQASEQEDEHVSENEEEVVLLSEQEMNQLGAKIVRAEIMGDTEIAAKLKEQLEKARENNERHKKLIEENKVKGKDDKDNQVVVLTRTDRKGLVRPLSEGHHGKEKGRKKNRGKVDTHSGKERDRYFDDDDKFSLRQLVEREKTGTAEDQNMMFARLAGRSTEKTNDDFQVDDMFVSKAARKQSEAKMEEKDRAMAIHEHRKVATAMEKCQFCFDNCPKHLIISIGVKVYLCLPNHRSLTEGHCLIVPMQHVASGTVVDEDVWNEIQMFRRGIVKMFEGMDQDIVFMETCMGLKHFPHMYLECIPMPKETGDLAPIYFKKAIQDAGPEWAQNKKLVDLSQRDIRRSVPKGFPYFAVDFGMQGGFAHVIEDERTFPRYFGREIVGGMVEAEPQLWRKPHKENFDDQRKKVLQFADWWKPFDWTSNLNKDS
ncbi:hypothetical protein FSP39_020282 [Pinctada imbricata]|uniref:DNA mismatch repair protein MSH3 n=1 Tax=Pinctada imbricata TaxID=66713 RepID=A0AA89C7V2_PINIB|nr:hypothetical protein FSP39_020282 [Pinctada imbricata]